MTRSEKKCYLISKRYLFFTSLADCQRFLLMPLYYSALDSWSRGRGFDCDRCIIRATTLGKLFTPYVPLFTKQYNLVPCECLHSKSAVLLASAFDIGSNEQGYCRAVLRWFSNCIEPRYKSSALPLTDHVILSVWASDIPGMTCLQSGRVLS